MDELKEREKACQMPSSGHGTVTAIRVHSSYIHSHKTGPVNWPVMGGVRALKVKWGVSLDILNTLQGRPHAQE